MRYSCQLFLNIQEPLKTVFFVVILQYNAVFFTILMLLDHVFLKLVKKWIQFFECEVQRVLVNNVFTHLMSSLDFKMCCIMFFFSFWKLKLFLVWQVCNIMLICFLSMIVVMLTEHMFILFKEVAHFHVYLKQFIFILSS